MSLAVYGNLISDVIATINTPLVAGASHPCRMRTRNGGLANFVRACYDMPVAKCVMNLSNAIVIADQSTNTRTGIVEWSDNTVELKPLEADWHHIMYLDRLSITPEELGSMKGGISVDFCDSDDLVDFPEVYEKYFPFIDLLIVSEVSGRIKESTCINEQQLRDMNLNVDMIVHSPELIYHKKKDGTYTEYVVEKETGLNVTGAGDYLAARCLINMLTTGNPNLQLSHAQTLHLLKEQS